MISTPLKQYHNHSMLDLIVDGKCLHVCFLDGQLVLTLEALVQLLPMTMMLLEKLLDWLWRDNGHTNLAQICCIPNSLSAITNIYSCAILQCNSSNRWTIYVGYVLIFCYLRLDLHYNILWLYFYKLLKSILSCCCSLLFWQLGFILSCWAMINGWVYSKLLSYFRLLRFTLSCWVIISRWSSF